MLPRLAVVALLGLFAAGSPRPASPLPSVVDAAIHEITAAELRRHVAVLASDELSGRGVGHPGNAQAEQYIASALRDAQVPPALPNYFQAVAVYQPVLGPAGHLTVRTSDKPLADLSTGSDFYPLPSSSDVAVSGPLVFARHGISAPDLRHDDYARVNAIGAIVLVLDDLPDALRHVPSLSSDQKSDFGSVERKAADARRHGAAGLIIVRPYLGDPGVVWPENPSVRSASYRLYGPMRAAPLAVAVISEDAAAPLRHALERRQTLAVHLTPGVIARPVVMDNVLGIIDARQPSAEMVVVGAHLDHDGIDEAGRIYNGADDNASGTSAVLAIASAFARAAAQGQRPARAVVFALWNGEEKGSLGAEHYVTSPVPARRIVANLNLDMIGREEEIRDPDDPRFRGFARTTASQSTNVVHLLGYSYSPDLARTVERANDSIRLAVKEDYDHDSQGLVRRSDNWPFLEHGIPAIFLTTGLHPDYHTPDDDTDRIDFAKLERITELAGRAAWMTADGDAPRLKSR